MDSAAGELAAIAKRLRVRADEGAGIARVAEKRVAAVELEGAAGEDLRDGARERRRRAESIAAEMEELAAYLMRQAELSGGL